MTDNEGTEQNEQQGGTGTGSGDTPVVVHHSVINEVVEAVMDMIDALGLFADTVRGPLGTGNGIAVEVGPSTPNAVYLSKDTYTPLDVIINAKHYDLLTLTEAMNTIHSKLTRATSYTSADNWQIVDISTATYPQIIGREPNNDWLAASALAVKVYQRGD